MPLTPPLLPGTRASGRDVPAPSRIAALARAARVIERGCDQADYSDAKRRRLLWETAFFILEGRHAPFMPSPHTPLFRRKDTTP